MKAGAKFGSVICLQHGTAMDACAYDEAQHLQDHQLVSNNLSNITQLHMICEKDQVWWPGGRVTLVYLGSTGTAQGAPRYTSPKPNTM